MTRIQNLDPLETPADNDALLIARASDGKWFKIPWTDLPGSGAGSGTVTSVGITGGTGITSTGGPVTSSGSITVALDSATQTSLSNADTAYGWGDHAAAGYATEAYTDAAVAALVDSSPGTLDTLNELAAALGDDPNFATTITASLAGKAASSHTHTLANITDSGDFAAVNEATQAQIRALTASQLGVSTQRLRDAAALVTISGASNWIPNFATLITGQWVVTADRTVSNPSTIIPGKTINMLIKGNSTTPWTISWGSEYKGSLPTAAVTNTAWLWVSLTAIDTSYVMVSHVVAEL